MCGGDVNALNVDSGLWSVKLGGDVQREEFTFDADKFSGVLVYSISDDVVVTASDDDSIHVSLPQRSTMRYEIEEGKTLKIIGKSEKKKLQFTFWSPDENIYISVPRGTAFDYDIASVSGDVKLTGINAGAVTIETVSGDADVSGVTMKTLKIDTTSGDADVSCTAESYAVDTTSGDVKLRLPGGRDDYSVKISTVSGDRNVKNGGSGVPVEVDTTSGDVELYFGK